MKASRYLAAGAATVLALGLTACGGSTGSSSSGGSSGGAAGAPTDDSKCADAEVFCIGLVTDTGKVAASALTKRIRDEDAAAFGRLKGKMTVVELTADEQSKWAGIFSQGRQRLGQGTFPADLVSKLEGMAK